MQLRVVLDSRPACLYLLSAGILGMHTMPSVQSSLIIMVQFTVWLYYIIQK